MLPPHGAWITKAKFNTAAPETVISFVMSSKVTYLTIDMYRMQGSNIEDNNRTAVIADYCALVKFG